MNDDDLDRLLKSAGPREKPPAEVEHAVRKRLHAEWSALVGEERARSRNRRYLALAASVLAAAVGSWIAVEQAADSAPAVGTLAVASGEIRGHAGWLSGWHRMQGGDIVLAGRTIETGADGRAALALPDGLSARLDRNTRVVTVDREHLHLERGTLYVDSGGKDLGPSRLQVVTDSGSVRHVGTQYEVSVLPAGMQLRIREGQVEWRSADGAVQRGRSGEQLVISGDGRVRREAVPPYGASWDWVSETAPTMDLEGMPLTRFLAWAGRELGREVRLSPALSEPELATIVVHGSTRGLTPVEVLNVVLATTSLEATIVDGEIIVARRGGK